MLRVSFISVMRHWNTLVDGRLALHLLHHLLFNLFLNFNKFKFK